MPILKIGYFPTTDLQSILYLPVITALTGALYFGCFIGLFGIAPFMWIELLKNKHTCRVIVGKENVDKAITAYEGGIINLEDTCNFLCLLYSNVSQYWIVAINYLNQATLLSLSTYYFLYIRNAWKILGILEKRRK